MTKSKKDNGNIKEGWVLMREGETKNIFKNRKAAVTYLRELLAQTLEDFKDQDKTDTYDYSFKIPEIEIKPVDWRESYLGL